MIDILNEVLENLLENELPIENNEVDVVFKQPTSEWSGQLNRPTLNLFLYDVRENVRLRNVSPAWHKRDHRQPGQVTMEAPWKRVDFYYMITAWATDVNDEHRLLARTLKVLFGNPNIKLEKLSEEFRELEELKKQPSPIIIQIAQPDALTKPTDIWSVLESQPMRPALSCVITGAVDPYKPIELPIVRSFELRVGQAKRASLQRIDSGTLHHTWSVGGFLLTNKSLQNARLVLLERGVNISLQQNGTWGLSALLNEGEYTLELTSPNNKPFIQKLIVPSETYNFKW